MNDKSGDRLLSRREYRRLMQKIRRCFREKFLRPADAVGMLEVVTRACAREKAASEEAILAAKIAGKE